jgi:uncharacterized protein (TIGR02246 family)
MDPETRVRRLEDRDACRELRYRYNHTLDSRSWDDWVDLFTDDGRFEIEGRGAHEGHDELRELTERFAAEYECSVHVALNPVIEIDGDRAAADWYLDLFYVLSDGTTGRRLGTYEDVYRTVDGTWKIESASVRFTANDAVSLAGAHEGLGG